MLLMFRLYFILFLDKVLNTKISILLFLQEVWVFPWTTIYLTYVPYII